MTRINIVAAPYRHGTTWATRMIRSSMPDQKVIKEKPISRILEDIRRIPADVYYVVGYVVGRDQQIEPLATQVDSGARVLHLGRNPHDYIRSAHRHFRRDGQTEPANGHKVEENYVKWHRYFMATDQPYMFLKVEDLWRDRSLWEAVGDFFETPWEHHVAEYFQPVNPSRAPQDLHIPSPTPAMLEVARDMGYPV